VTVPARHLRLVVSANPDHVVRSCVCVVSSDGIVLIGVSGEIDVETGPKISAAVHAALERQPSSIVIDLAQVSYFGVVGATALLEARQRCQRKGVNFILLHPSRAAAFLLSIIGLVSPAIYLLNPPKQKRPRAGGVPGNCQFAPARTEVRPRLLQLHTSRSDISTGDDHPLAGA
jgi:anti-anti-sigma factor